MPLRSKDPSRQTAPARTGMRGKRTLPPTPCPRIPIHDAPQEWSRGGRGRGHRNHIQPATRSKLGLSPLIR